jgi:hypothetical protein
MSRESVSDAAFIYRGVGSSQLDYRRIEMLAA